MPGLQWTYREFINSVRMSRFSYILLEGTQDKSFFEILRKSLLERLGNDGTRILNITIETAEIIRSEVPGVGNRQKVENICALVNGKSFQGRIVGFVDREFREFDFAGKINDKLGAQLQSGRLLWSRGHSIENYLFDFEVVRDSFYYFTEDLQVANRALQRLEESFIPMLRIGCALSLAASELSSLEKVRGTVSWQVIDSSHSPIRLDLSKWKSMLVQQRLLTVEDAETIAERFEHWHLVASSSSYAEVRWACDGHMGFKLMWAVYASLVHDVRQREVDSGRSANNQRDSIVRISESIKFNHLADSWTKTNSFSDSDSPWACFQLIGFNT